MKIKRPFGNVLPVNPNKKQIPTMSTKKPVASTTKKQIPTMSTKKITPISAGKVLNKAPTKRGLKGALVRPIQPKILTPSSDIVEVSSIGDNFYMSVLDSLEKEYSIGSKALSSQDRADTMQFTGSLVVSLILGGGIVPGGWYTFFGFEQTGKSTHMLSIVTSVYKDIPIVSYWDYEGSTDPIYIERMFLNEKVNAYDLFGIANDKGKWVKEPKIRYYSPQHGEDFFDFNASLLRSLPDKSFINGDWFYVFPKTKTNMSSFAGKYSKTLYTKTGKLYIEAKPGMQGLILTDSYSAMTPKASDEKVSGAMAIHARMFSEHGRRVRSKLFPKMVSIIGANQFRAKPGVAFGSPFYEPGGNALKHYSDVRIEQTQMSVPHGKGKIEKEQSVQGSGEDCYHYIRLKAIKNKLGTPYLEGWIRLWVSDFEGKAHGVCPVWDTFSYLRDTGQLTGTMKKMDINIISSDKVVSLSGVTWLDFKRIILLQGVDLKTVCDKYGIKFNPRIRERCIQQFKTKAGDNRSAMELYFANLKSGNTVGKKSKDSVNFSIDIDEESEVETEDDFEIDDE